jgi:hypothetical protein
MYSHHPSPVTQLPMEAIRAVYPIGRSIIYERDYQLLLLLTSLNDLEIDPVPQLSKKIDR